MSRWGTSVSMTTPQDAGRPADERDVGDDVAEPKLPPKHVDRRAHDNDETESASTQPAGRGTGGP